MTARPAAEDTSARRACPGCAAPMDRANFARRPFGTLELDFCFACRAIWFDAYESAQLTPGATLDLFRLIHERGAETARPTPELAHCPVCRARLVPTHDLQRTNRFTYHRCPTCHGRFTSFFQFLREKQFVRSLSPPEIERLRATVRQVRCSSCGAPIDVARDASCAYCHAPLAVLDADAMKRTVAELSEQERNRTTVDPAAAIDALIAGRRVESRLGRIERSGMEGVDLLNEAIGLFLAL